MESNIPNMKALDVSKGPITLLMTKNGPIMIVQNRNQLGPYKPKVSNVTQQTRESANSQAVRDKPISRNIESQEKTTVNKVGTKEISNILSTAENACILNAAASERDKSLRAKRLIDSVQLNKPSDVPAAVAAPYERGKSLKSKSIIDSLQADWDTEFDVDVAPVPTPCLQLNKPADVPAAAAPYERVNSLKSNSIIDSLQLNKTANAAENERNKSLRAKRLIDGLQMNKTEHAADIESYERRKSLKDKSIIDSLQLYKTAKAAERMDNLQLYKNTNTAEKMDSLHLYKTANAAEKERNKSLRAKRLIDSLQQNETADLASNERSKSLKPKSIIDSLQLTKTADAAENERNKSLRAKRLIESLQQIETPESLNSKVVTHTSGVEWFKKGYEFPNRSHVTVKESENYIKENNSNMTGNQSGFRNKDRSYPCHKCGKSFNNLDAMMKHFASHRNEKLPTPSAKKIKTSPKKSTVKIEEHKQIKKELDCPFCEYFCNESKDMEIHLKIHEEVIANPFSCDTCGERFTSNSKLMMHIKTHTGKKNFSCSMCGWKFSLKQSLLSHMISHAGEKPFPCTICGKKFKTESYRDIHKSKHVEGENVCPICSRVFRSVHVKNQHLKTHDIEEGKYICGVCEMVFQSKNDLIDHLSEHTGNDEPVEVVEESFLCPYCEEIFINRDDLIEHFEAMHV